MSMDANRKRVLDLAEQSDWDEVLLLVAQNPTLAQAQDDFGMLPLHWACTEPSVDLVVVSTLTRAFPRACQLENLSGMLPLHVAIKAKAPGLLVNALLDVYPQAALAKDGNGHYPVDLAIANNLPSFTIDLIRKVGSKSLQSPSKMQMLSMGGQTSVGSTDINQNEEDVPVKPRLKLKDLLSQLHQLSVDVRVNNTSSSNLTYSSSFSSAFSPTADGLVSVLWNPSDRFGIVLEPAVKDMGARIKSFSSRSDVLGIESLAVGDVLKNINGTSVVNTSFASIMRFMKHSKATCKLRFKSVTDASATSKCSTGSNPAMEQDNAIYSKVVEMLETTLKKVSAVEESVMSLCT